MLFLFKKEFFLEKVGIIKVFSNSVLNYCHKLGKINLLKKFDKLICVSQKL